MKRYDRNWSLDHIAPWPDYAGKFIQEGDTIRHPGGEEGVVVVLAHEENLGDRWRVRYADGTLSRLGIQIGNKGQAVVVKKEPTVKRAAVRVADDGTLHIECRFNDGQKFAAVEVDSEFPELAQRICNLLNGGK